MIRDRLINTRVLIWLLGVYFVYCVNSKTPLYLTRLIESGKLEKARQMSRVKSHHFRCGTESYSGFLTVDKRFNSNLFFWFFKSKNPKAPVLLWLNGGPGASSMNALFTLNGPFKIKENLNLRCRKYSWTKEFSVVFVDNPVGAGFSFTESDDGFATSGKYIGDTLYNALQQFFTLFSDQKSNDFYMTGVSYAGKYISSLGYKIHTANESIANLKGIAVGNGLFDPITSLSYGPLFYKFGLIDEKQLIVFNEKEKEIQTLLANEQYEEGCKKWGIFIRRQQYRGKRIATRTTGYNYFFDVRYTNNPRNNSIVEVFLNKSEIREALHVGGVPFILGGDNNQVVIKPLFNDTCRSVKPLIPILLENYKVLLYNGNFDLQTPAVIANQFLKTLQWKYQEEYLAATRSIWKVDSEDSEVAGYIKRAHNFREVVIRNAGHIVQETQPRASFDLITKFVNDEL